MTTPNSARPQLCVGYSILIEGTTTFSPDPPLPAAEVIVAVQGHGQFLCDLPDAKIQRLASLGVARSRNAVIDAASGEFLIFGDDDIAWHPDGIRAAIAHLKQHPELSLVLARTVDRQGLSRKRYPNRSHRLNRWNTAKTATYEMVVRLDDVRSSRVRFDENFGAGMPNHLGDEYAFIVDLLRAGRRGVFLPVVLAEHGDVSSGMRFGSDSDAARAAILGRVHGRGAVLARALFALRPGAPLGSLARRIRFIVRPPRT